jgi:hypothetical protein
MAKAKRNRRAKNSLENSSAGALVKADANPGPAIVIRQSQAVRALKASLFSAELEEVIEIIARERVYRAMLHRLGQRLLTGPTSSHDPHV